MPGQPATTPAGKQTDVSAPANQADRPPRLAAAINEPPNDPDRSIDPSSDALPLSGIDASILEDVINSIASRLQDDDGWATVWDTPAGNFPNPAELVEPEETWARLVDQLFLGSAYGGPEIAADFPRDGAVGAGGYHYVLSRFVNDSKDADTGEVVSDPAYSLVVACQQLTTYAALARGLSLEDDMRGIGFPASQATGLTPVFDSQLSRGGHWYSAAPIYVLKLDLSVQQMPLTVAKDPAQARAGSENWGPGTVYAYNPIHYLSYVMAAVPDNELLRGKNGELIPDSNGNPQIDPRFGIKRISSAQDLMKLENASAAELAKAVSGVFGPQVTPPAQSPTDAMMNNTSDSSGTTVKLPMSVQLDGSHINMVLRTYTGSDGKPYVQMLDATAHGAPDLTMFQLGYGGFVGGGIFAGEASTWVGGEFGSFVGMGTLPPVADGEPMLERMTRARPVGLARLVLAKREVGGPMTLTPIGEEDIYFISKMVPMWDADIATRNYNVSRLLWSLRNPPYYIDIQAFWVVYAPRGYLADVMWAEGARARPLEEMIDDALNRSNAHAEALGPIAAGAPKRSPTSVRREQLSTGLDTMPMSILSHDARGRSMEVWRAHLLKANVGEGAPPKIIRELFINTGAHSMAWNKAKNDGAKAASLARQARLTAINQELLQHPTPERAAELEAEQTMLRAASSNTVPQLLESLDPPFSTSPTNQVEEARNSINGSYSTPSIENALALPSLLGGDPL